MRDAGRASAPVSVPGSTQLCTVFASIACGVSQPCRSTADSAPSAPEELTRSHELMRLAVAMDGLQPRQRAALTLFYYEDCSGEEAAAILNISLRAFWSLLHRARQAVQELMNDTNTLAKANPS
jgi:RNA polymerase sigma factor (sigma-70 family)